MKGLEIAIAELRLIQLELALEALKRELKEAMPILTAENRPKAERQKVSGHFPKR